MAKSMGVVVEEREEEEEEEEERTGGVSTAMGRTRPDVDGIDEVRKREGRREEEEEEAEGGSSATVCARGIVFPIAASTLEIIL